MRYCSDNPEAREPEHLKITPAATPKTMTPEQINIAIAEACGWQINKVAQVAWKDGTPYGMVDGCSCMIPDYYHDLNAMHEAENALTRAQQINYHSMLERVVIKNGYSPSMATGMHTIHATATQRAEAFLRCIGKWTTTEEGK
jgi:hypothetical protein